MSWLMGLLACDEPPSDELPSKEPCVQLEVVAGIPGVAGAGVDGRAATETMLSQPQDVTVAADGTWWVDDYNNHRVRQVDADGVSHVVLGSGFPGGGEGGSARAEPLDHPTMVLPDPELPGVLWVAATGNHRIGRLDLEASLVAFPYGTGFSGFEGDGGPASEAWFWRPSSLAFGDAGVMYISDRMNQVVRAISPDGIVMTVAGTPGAAGYAGDGGPATEALLNAPEPTEPDPGNRLDVRDGRLVLADTGNHVVREIDLATGRIETLASGLLAPHDVAIGPDGTVYVADTENACVRAVGPDGELTTALGTCGEPGTVDEGLLTWPVGVEVTDDGILWVADRNQHVVVRSCP
jgi:DNA-binding beta-propeller fold protein YncE